MSSRRPLYFPPPGTPPIVSSSDPNQADANAEMRLKIIQSLLKMTPSERIALYNEMNFYNPNRTNGPPMDAEQAHELAMFNQIMDELFPDEAERIHTDDDSDEFMLKPNRSRSSRSSTTGREPGPVPGPGVFGVIPPVQMVNPPPVPIPPDFLTSLQTLAKNNEKNTIQYIEEMDKISDKAVKNNKSGNLPRVPPWWKETWIRFTPEQKAFYEALPVAFKDYGSYSWNNWSELPPPPHPHPPSSANSVAVPGAGGPAAAAAPFGVRRGRPRRAGLVEEGGKPKSRSRTVMKPRKYLKPRKHLKSKKHLKSRK